MEFPFSVTKIFKDKITKVKNDLLPEGFSDPGPFGRQCPTYVAQVVDALGTASADAQGLAHPVTSADRLKNSDHTVYVMVDNSNGSKNGRIVGFLKTGFKNLYLYDKNGHNHETKPLCVLDFFIHDALQRRGLGKELFDHMLSDTDVSPKHLALDRPSDTFMAFVRKHYGLFKTIPQVNHYAIYDDFFSKRHDGKSQYLSRLHGRTSLRGGRQPLTRRSVTSMGQQHNAGQQAQQHIRQQQHQQQSSQNQHHRQQQSQQYPHQHQLPSHQLSQQHDHPQQHHQTHHHMHQYQMAQQQHEMAQQNFHVQQHMPPQNPQHSQQQQQQLPTMEGHENQQQSDNRQQHQEHEQHQAFSTSQQEQNLATAESTPPTAIAEPSQQMFLPQQQQQSLDPQCYQEQQLAPQSPHGHQQQQLQHQQQLQQQYQQQQYQQQPASQGSQSGRLWGDNQRSSVGECLTYPLVGSPWGANRAAVAANATMPAPAGMVVPRSAGKATMIPTPGGPVMLVPPQMTPDGPHVQGNQPPTMAAGKGASVPSTPCSPSGAMGSMPPPSPLVAGGDGCGVAHPGSPRGAPQGTPTAPGQPPLDKNAAPTAYELMRKSKYSHTPLW